MMDAVALRKRVKKQQEENPTLQFDIDEFGLVRVNGIEYGAYYDEVQAMKRRSAIKKLRTTILPKKVQDWKEKKNKAAIVEKVPPVQVPSEPKLDTINTPPAAPEPEETTEEPRFSSMYLLLFQKTCKISVRPKYGQ